MEGIGLIYEEVIKISHYLGGTMLATCLKILVQKGYGTILKEIRKDEKNEPLGFKDCLEKVEYKQELPAKSNELILLIEIDGKKFPVSIGVQFRKKFQQPKKCHSILTRERIYKIESTMPSEINVESTGYSRHPYQVEDREINAWYENVKAVS